ncbi:hypothetical protein ACFSKW_50780 [Nonomuraea mangrovi]|uniref:Uncharacterized protein n=1 Tax=Nonomuraea mangrovi TaxID=2316207 RepID=A0ABW4TD65_9ACTN
MALNLPPLLHAVDEVERAVTGNVRRSVNVLLCLVAVATIGWSGTLLWQNWKGRQQIDEACAGLVPAGRVLALSPAGGTISHRTADKWTIELDAGLPQYCELLSTEAGAEYRTGEPWSFFKGVVGVLPSNEPVIPETPGDNLVDRRNPTYPYEPLGGGISGTVTASGVSVDLPCARGMSNGQPITALWAWASLKDPGPPFTDNGQLTSHDRDTLAEIAVITANNLAERLGCAERLPDPPEDIPALTPGPTPAAGADGTCAWYRKAGFARHKQLPDQVLESRIDDKLWFERCGLVLSSIRANGLWRSDAAELDDLSRPSDPGDWFVSLHTYSGERAKRVHLKATHGEPPVVAEPGKAGRGETSVWWASSRCEGKPQIHTMTVAYGYDKLMRSALEKVFRAYVTDVVARRGCTDTAFPTSSTFRPG